MLLRFSKMHGLGTDLMVIDLISQHAYIQPQHIRTWSDRRQGVGFLRLALIEVPQHPDVDFSCRVFDSDGAEVDWLASDVCCVARLVADKRLISKAQMRIELRHTVLDVQVHADGSVSLPIAPPEVMAERIALPNGFIQQHSAAPWLLERNLNMLSMNGLHAVLRVNDLAQTPLAELAAYLEQQQCLPRRTSLSVVQVQDANNLQMAVWQLGQGPVDSFQHSFCAAALCAIAQGWVKPHVHVECASGKTRAWLHRSEPQSHVYFTGSATRIYEGQIRL
jgi:diaminopimelate epimerase